MKQIDVQRDDFTHEVNLEKSGPTFAKLTQELERRVIGQPRAVRRAARAILSFMTKTNDPKRPVGCLLFLGPSGVGKTYLAKELAHVWIGDSEAGLDPFVFIDCTSLSLEHERTGLTGAPPSYVGYDDTVPLESLGLYDERKRGINEYMRELETRLGRTKTMLVWLGGLQEKSRKLLESVLPYRSVLILDEFEKAHMNVHIQLLSILQEGKLRLANGHVVDFTGTLIVLTSNVGSAEVRSYLKGTKHLGFSIPAKERIEAANKKDDEIYKAVIAAVEARFAHIPELLGRIGKKNMIVFHALKHADYLKILDLMLGDIANLFSGGAQSPGPITISYTDEFRNFLLEESASPEYGARALESAVDRFVRAPIAKGVESGEIRKGDQVLLDVKHYEANENGTVRKWGDTVISRTGRPPKNLPRFEVRSYDSNEQERIRKELDREVKRILKLAGLDENPSEAPQNQGPDNSPKPLAPPPDTPPQTGDDAGGDEAPHTS